MHKPHHGERLLTEIDFARLNNLQSGQIPPELVDTLNSLDLVPSREIRKRAAIPPLKGSG